MACSAQGEGAEPQLCSSLWMRRWLANSCPYSDAQCNYAHGQHELRYLSPEMVKAAEAAKAAAAGADGGQQAHEGPKAAEERDSGGAGPPAPGPQGEHAEGGSGGGSRR